jgi:hypothetical protein
MLWAMPQEIRAEARAPVEPVGPLDEDHEGPLDEILDLGRAGLVAEEAVDRREVPHEQAITGGRVTRPPGAQQRLILLLRHRPRR